MTKGKVPSKSSYNKTGGGEQPDDEHLLKIQNSILNLIDSTVIHGHEEVMEAEVSFIFENNNNKNSSVNNIDLNLLLKNLMLVL